MLVSRSQWQCRRGGVVTPKGHHPTAHSLVDAHPSSESLLSETFPVSHCPLTLAVPAPGQHLRLPLFHALGHRLPLPCTVPSSPLFSALRAVVQELTHGPELLRGHFVSLAYAELSPPVTKRCYPCPHRSF